MYTKMKSNIDSEAIDRYIYISIRLLDFTSLK